MGTQGVKRKRPDSSNDLGRKKKRVLSHDARVISSQTSGRAFGNGEVDVDKFVKAREFEIKALEDGIKRAKKVLSNRAFQNVPRDLRRRTASHNAKRVPQRLRARAERDMREDKTSTVTPRIRKKSAKMRLRLDVVKRLKALKTEGHKSETDRAEGPVESESHMQVDGKQDESTDAAIKTREPRVKKDTLSQPPKVKAKYRKRQIHKTWLPTHIFHAKRAHMTPPKEPLWRMAIPLSPTAKSYRPTHRAANLRGAIAWDMSYISTILLEGSQECMVKLFIELGVGSGSSRFWTKDAIKWMQGSRFWEGWLYEENGWPTKGIAPTTIIWRGQGNGEASMDGSDQRLSNSGKQKRQAFVTVHPSAFLQTWEEILLLAKRQHPSVALQDLRFEVGCIEVLGPASSEALANVVQPARTLVHDDKARSVVSDVWSLLGTISDPSLLPSNVLLALDAQDPRLIDKPPRTHEHSNPERHQQLLQTLASWPLDQSLTTPRLFDRASRMEACRRLPSQKSINRRKTAAAPGASLEQRVTDPRIPCLLLASRGLQGGQGSWKLMLPWKCVLPFWYCLMHQPISTGGTIRFGGLDEKRQVLLETGMPWFPGDFPGTKAGMAWEEAQQTIRKKEWEKRPKGKRVEWGSVDLGGDEKGEVGVGWACDWQRLRRGCEGESEPGIFQLPRGLTRAAMEKHLVAEDEAGKIGLATIKIVMLAGGVSTTCARIYRLPTNDASLRQQWLSLLPRNSSISSRREKDAGAKRLPKNALSHLRQQELASSLLQDPEADEKNSSKEPRVPDEADLIGFVTTGSFNLREGRGMAVGAVWLQKAYEEGRKTEVQGTPTAGREGQLCIVRNAGHSKGRLALWELV